MISLLHLRGCNVNKKEVFFSCYAGTRNNGFKLQWVFISIFLMAIGVQQRDRLLWEVVTFLYLEVFFQFFFVE